MPIPQELCYLLTCKLNVRQLSFAGINDIVVLAIATRSRKPFSLIQRSPIGVQSPEGMKAAQ